MDNDLKYGDASLRVRESFISKIKGELNKNATDSGMRLIKLFELIPNWETYLTKKQLEVARKFITCMSAYEVDHQLKLSYGTTQQRLFGNNKSSKGALGRLEEVRGMLENNGYYERIEKRKEMARKQNPPKKHSPETIEKAKELIRLVVSMPDYEKYLTKGQSEKVFQFLRFRSFGATARHFGITETTLRQALFGKKDEDGALSKLKKASLSKMVNSWEDV